MVTVPLRAISALPVEPLAGKIVLDTNNYYWERDGHVPELDRGETTSSGLLQEHLPTSKVVKAFNHITAGGIARDGTPAGTLNRRALATSSNFPEAVEFVTELYDAIGFDTVNVSPLSPVLAGRAGPPRVRGKAEPRGARSEPGPGASHDLSRLGCSAGVADLAAPIRTRSTRTRLNDEQHNEQRPELLETG